MKQIIPYLKPYRAPMRPGMLLIALSSVCSLLLPTLMSDILNRGIYLPDREDIFFCCVKMLPVTLISLAAIPGGNYFSALLANRRLLILDKVTSNVDTRTEMLLQKAMDKLMRGRTCFAIAHGLSAVVDADRILVINDGQIVGTGTHRSLLKQKGFYYRLYTSQYAV